MGKRTCSIEGCGRDGRIVRGWCTTHYGRWLSHGDPLFTTMRAYRTPEESFAARTERRGDCLIWTGYKDRDGYGEMRVEGKSMLVHRYAWARVNGPIPDGKFLDHRFHCDTACCEIGHLRLATIGENNSHRSGAMPGRRYDLPRGVYRNRKGYMAQVKHRGVSLHLGTYGTVEEASQVACAKREALFGEFAGRA